MDLSSEQSVPASPCQNMFQYQREGYEWTGLAQVQSLPLGQAMKTEVMLSLRAKLPSVIMFLFPSYYHLVIHGSFSLFSQIHREGIRFMYHVYFRKSP